MYKEQYYFYPSTTHKLAFTSSSAATSAVGAQTYYVRLITNVACWVTIGKSPTATNTDIYLPAATIEIFKIKPGEKVAAIEDTGGGNLNVTELTA